MSRVLQIDTCTCLETLGKMKYAAECHLARLTNKEDDDYNLAKAKVVKESLEAVTVRLAQLGE